MASLKPLIPLGMFMLSSVFMLLGRTGASDISGEKMLFLFIPSQ